MTNTPNLELIQEEMGTGKIFVDAVVNGENERFFLDTGSPETFVHSARWKNEKIVESSAYYSASGTAITFDYIKLNDLSISDIARFNFQVGLIADDKSEPQKMGLNIFRGEAIMFDFPNRTLSRSLDLKDGAREFAFGKKGHIVLTAKIGFVDLPCVFDTGAGFSAIDVSCIEENPSLFELIDGDGIAGDGNGTQISCGLYRITNLQVGDSDFSNSNIVGMDLQPLKDALEIDGPVMILGFNHLAHRAWQFDFQNMKFNIPRPYSE